MKLHYICLGTDLTKENNGFVGKGGGWSLYKMFYEDSDGYGEFYITINRKTDEAELKFKDKTYSKPLLKALKEELE